MKFYISNFSNLVFSEDEVRKGDFLSHIAVGEEISPLPDDYSREEEE